jgi:NADH:ubiquinone oxidoreductase subunit H
VFLQQIVNSIVLSLIVLVPIILSVAFFTLAERKIMASIQRRKGPNVVGV